MNRKLRIFAIGTVSMLILMSFLILSSPNVRSAPMPATIYGVIAYPEAEQAYVLNPTTSISGGNKIAKFDYDYCDIGQGYDTAGLHYAVVKDFSQWDSKYNWGDAYYDAQAVKYGNYWDYFSTDHIINWSDIHLTSVYLVMFGKPSGVSGAMELTEGVFSIAKDGWSATNNGNGWLVNSTSRTYSQGEFYSDRPANTIPWNNSDHNPNPWINTTNDWTYSTPIVPVTSYADYIANGGSAWSGTGAEPWRIQYEWGVPNGFTGLRHLWNITEFITFDDLNSTDLTISFTMPQKNIGRYADYLGLWFRFSYGIVWDYYYTYEGVNASVMYGIIWLVIVFFPAMILAQAIPKWGFVGGLGLMLFILGFSQSGFTPVMFIGIITLGLLAYKGID